MRRGDLSEGWCQMQLSLRVVERITQPIQYANVRSRIAQLEQNLQKMDKNAQVALGKVSIAQNGTVEEYGVGSTLTRKTCCQTPTMLWFADATLHTSDQNLINSLKLYPYDDHSMLAFAL